MRYSCALKALTERQPLTEKKAPRARAMSGKAVVALCATSFLVGLLLSGRTPLLTPPSSSTSGLGSRVSLFAEDCDQMPVSIHARQFVKCNYCLITGHQTVPQYTLEGIHKKTLV